MFLFFIVVHKVFYLSGGIIQQTYDNFKLQNSSYIQQIYS